MSEELKACWHCKGRCVLEPQLDEKTFCAYCLDCGAGTGIGSREEVIKEWNNGEAEHYD